MNNYPPGVTDNDPYFNSDPDGYESGYEVGHDPFPLRHPIMKSLAEVESERQEKLWGYKGKFTRCLECGQYYGFDSPACPTASDHRRW